MISPSLAEAIESALAMVQKMPDLSVPGLEVPAQPTGPSDADGEAVTAEVEDITDAADADDPAAGSD
jgi:hypothetical protein